MTKKSKILKNLLTSASAAAIVMSAASSAYAAPVVRTTTGAATAGDAAATVGLNPPGNWVAGSSAVLAGHSITANGAQLTISSVRSTGAGSSINTAGGPLNVSVGSVVGTHEVAANVVVGTTLTLTGVVGAGGAADLQATTINDYSKLGTVNLANAGSTLNVNLATAGSIELNGAIVAKTVNQGVINLQNSTTTFKNTIGTAANALTKVDVQANANAVFEKNVFVNGGVNLNGAGTVTFANSVVLTGEIDQQGAVNNGVVVFEQDATVTAGIGKAVAVASITLGDTAQGTVQVKQGPIKSQVINVKNDSTLKIGEVGAVQVETTDGFLNASGTDGQGTLEVTTNNSTFKGAIGSSAANGAIRAVQFDTIAGQLEVSGPGIWAKELKSDDGASKGTLIVKGQAADGKFTLSASTQSKGLSSLRVEDRIAGGAANHSIVTIDKDTTHRYEAGVYLVGANAHELILDEGATVSADVLQFNQIAQVLELKEGSSFTVENDKGVIQDIVANGVNAGIVKVTGNATLNANFTAGAQSVDTILFNVADKKLTSNANVISLNAGIDFTADGTLELTNDTGVANKLEITSPILANNAGAVAGTDFGTITANKLGTGKTLTITGDIGDPTANNKRLKELQVTGGADIELASDNVAIATLDIGSQNNTTTIGKGNALDVFIGQFTGDNGGTLSFNAGANAIHLREGTNLGAAAKPRRAIVFQGDNAVTLDDGVNLFAVDGLKNQGAGQVTLNFAGDSVVGAAVGANNNFKAINVKGANKTVEFLKDVKLNGDITISQNAKAKFSGNVTANNIQGTGNQLGDLVFVNTDAINVATTIGTGNALNSVELNGGNVTFTKAVTAAELSFTATKGLTATFKDKGGLANTNFTTTTADHNIVLDGELFSGAAANKLTLNGSVGSANNQFGYVQANRTATGGGKDNTLTVSGADFFADALTDTHASVTAAAPVGNNLVFTAANGQVRNVGQADKHWLNTNFAGTNFTVRGNFYSKDADLANNVAVNFGGDIAGEGALTLNNGSVANFTDGAILNMEVKANAANLNMGTLNFAGGAEINKALGAANLLAINFNANSGEKINVSEDLSANAISFKAAEVNARDNVTLTGKTTFAGTTLNLDDKALTLSGVGSELSGAATMRIAISADAASSGKVVVDGAASTLDLSKATSFTINVADALLLPKIDNEYTLFGLANGAPANAITPFATNTAVSVNDNSNGFVVWSYDKASNKLMRSNNAVAKLTDLLKGTDVAANDINALASTNNTGDAERFVNELVAMRNSDGTLDTAKIQDAVKRLTTSAALSAAQTSNDVYRAGTRVSADRAMAVAIPVAEGSASGMAAGDEHYMYGAWFMPFYNQTEQDTRSGTPGYKSTSYGATVGADTQVNADMTLGLAFTYAKTDIKHKGNIAGDKTKGDSYMFSVYGVQNLTNEWFVQGNASFGSTRFKNDQKRLTAGANQVARSRYDSTAFGGEMLFGYNYKQDSMTLTPMFGAAYSRFNDGGYTESGTTFQNTRVSRKATNMFEAIAGGKVQFASMNAADMDLYPEMHAFVRHDLLKNEESVQVKLNGTNGNLSSKKPKINHTYYNVGLGLMAKQGGEYEYGVGYDATFATKYVGHQGSLKIRMNF